MKNTFCRIAVTAIAMSLLVVGVVANSNPETRKQKLKPAELLEKHLNSIAPAEKLAALKSITAIGTSKAVFRGRGTGRADGLIVFASQGEKNMMGMKFPNPEYQFETMGYDGKNLTIGFAKPGKRSLLGSFLRMNEKTFKSGIMGGALSTSWELLRYNEKRGKLKWGGRKKQKDGTYHYKFKYDFKKGSDLKIAFYFDAETFRHVKTEYSRVINSGLGRSTGAPTRGGASARVDNSAQQSEIRYKMIEEFKDFKKEADYTLPHTYKLFLEIQTGNGSTKDEWTVNLSRFVFNQNIADGDFRVGPVS